MTMERSPSYLENLLRGKSGRLQAMDCTVPVFIGLLAILFFSVEQASAADFQGLGVLPLPPGVTGTPYSYAYDVSGDGSTVVGLSGCEAFRWTPEDGMVGVVTVSPACTGGACGVSADGSVLAGDNPPEAFRWTADGGMTGIGFLPGHHRSYALGVSADASVLVGGSYSSSETEAFRWSQEDGMVGLGILPGYERSWANAVSADGSVVVGESQLSGWVSEAFRWTSGTGMVGLGHLGSGYESSAHDLSADGSVVVGESWDYSEDMTPEAFLWTEESGMVGLGHLPGEYGMSRAYGVSADGSVVVGQSHSPDYPWQAFIWDEANGMRSLKEVLENDFGLDLTGWSLREATAISDDGLTIVGNGKNPSGEYPEAWRTQLTPVPIPGAVWLLGSGLIGLVGFRRKVRKRRQ